MSCYNCVLVVFTGTPKALIGQYCFARWRLSASSVVVVCNAACGWEGRPLGALSVGRPTLHGGPVRLRPVGGRHVVVVLCCYVQWSCVDRRSSTRVVPKYLTSQRLTCCSFAFRLRRVNVPDAFGCFNFLR